MQAEVLAVLRQSNVPLSAYDVLDRLRPGHPKLAPPTIYRALSALAQRGDVHKLESLRAYVSCAHDTCDHGTQVILAVCGGCGVVEETSAPGVLRDLKASVSETGFVPKRHVIEVHGECATCQSAEGAA